MIQAALEEFRRRRFGMFIHWGLYAAAGGHWRGQSIGDYIGEWLQARLRIPNRDYATLADSFNPTGFSADDWVRKARDAGMHYIVFTAKHHDGFAMYHSAYSAFNIVDGTPFGRDPLAELAAACRKYDVKLGIYYSHALDWSEPNGADPGDSSKNLHGVSWGNDWDFPDRSRKDFAAYFRQKALFQVRELLTRYGDVFLLWFDCPLCVTPEQSRELRDLVHGLQPSCLINSRIGNQCCDYYSLGDNQLLVAKEKTAFESPGTLNDTWGYKSDDHNWKSPRTIIGQLLALAENDCNYLLNVGPKPDGTFPAATDAILAALHQWFQENGDGVHDSCGTPFPQELPSVLCTRQGTTINCFLRQNAASVRISGLLAKVRQANVPFVQEDDELHLDCSQLHGDYPRVTLQFAETPRVRPELIPQDGTLTLKPAAAQICQHSGEERGRAGTAAGRSVVDVDGTTRAQPTQARIERGRLLAWHDPDCVIRWQLHFPGAGRYALSCRTEAPGHSAPWVGGRELEISVGGQRIRKELQADVAADTRYYATAESLLGEVAIAAAGPVELSLRTTKTTAPGAAAMAFIYLKLTIIPQ